MILQEDEKGLVQSLAHSPITIVLLLRWKMSSPRCGSDLCSVETDTWVEPRDDRLRTLMASIVDWASPSVHTTTDAPSEEATILAKPEPAPSSRTDCCGKEHGALGAQSAALRMAEPGHIRRPDISALDSSSAT